MAEIKIKDNKHKTTHLPNYTLPNTPPTPQTKKIIVKKNKTLKSKSKTPSPPSIPPPPPMSSPKNKNNKPKSICKNKKTKNPNECLTYKECMIAKGPKREYCRSKKNKK